MTDREMTIRAAKLMARSKLRRLEALHENAIEVDARKTREAVRVAEEEAYRERLVRQVPSPALLSALRGAEAKGNLYAFWIPVYRAELARRREIASREFAALIAEAQTIAFDPKAASVPSALEPWDAGEYTVTQEQDVASLFHVAERENPLTLCGRRKVWSGERSFCESLVDCLDCLDRYVAERNARSGNPA